MLDCTQWQCRPVQLEDRSAVEAIRARAGHQISAHAFTSLFLWQKVMGLSICLREDAFFVRFEQRGKMPGSIPVEVRRSRCVFSSGD